ncbi:hypothetical protein [Streptomyces sp. NPDC006610]
MSADRSAPLFDRFVEDPVRGELAAGHQFVDQVMAASGSVCQ